MIDCELVGEVGGDREFSLFRFSTKELAADFESVEDGLVGDSLGNGVAPDSSVDNARALAWDSAATEPFSSRFDTSAGTVSVSFRGSGILFRVKSRDELGVCLD